MSFFSLSVALLTAAREGHWEEVKEFVRCGLWLPIAVQLAFWQTPDCAEMAALRHGYLAIVSLLLQNSVLVDAATSDGWTVSLLYVEPFCFFGFQSLTAHNKKQEGHYGHRCLFFYLGACQSSRRSGFLLHLFRTIGLA